MPRLTARPLAAPRAPHAPPPTGARRAAQLWDSDRFSRDDFIGEAMLPLAPLNGQCSVVGGETVVVCAAPSAAQTGVPGTAFAKPVVVGKDGIWSLFRPQAADGKAVPNVLKLPSAIVLVGDGGGPEVATLTPQQAAIYLLGLKISASVRLPACSLAPCGVPGLLPMVARAGP